MTQDYQIHRTTGVGQLGILLEGGSKTGGWVDTFPIQLGIPRGQRHSIFVKDLVFNNSVAGTVTCYDYNTQTPGVQGSEWIFLVTSLSDGDTVALDVGLQGTIKELGSAGTLTFEIDTDGSWAAGNVPIKVPLGASNGEVAVAIADAINAQNEAGVCPFTALADVGTGGVGVRSKHYWDWAITGLSPAAMVTTAGAGLSVAGVAFAGAATDNVVEEYVNDPSDRRIEINDWFHNGCLFIPSVAGLEFSVRFYSSGHAKARAMGAAGAAPVGQ